MQRSPWIVGLVAAGWMSCSEASAPEPQAVMFFSLSAAPEGQCILNETFELPLQSNARQAATLGLSPDEADRLVNGEARVECTVSPLEGGSYDVSFRLASGVIANFQGSGLLSAGGGEMNINFSHSAGGVAQSNCTASVKKILDGAIHIDRLVCDDMLDRKSQNIHCSGSGAFILENCSK